jgi:hypothetical protein
MSRRLVPEPELQKSLRSNYPQNFDEMKNYLASKELGSPK